VRLSELENAVLGVVWRRGPCSAYLVKREFETALSASWSGSAGSIYPLVKKLGAAGLLLIRKEEWGRGTKTLLELSAAGQRALTEWAASVPLWAAQAGADPIRTRAFFLDVLSSDADRLRFVVSAEQATRSAIADLERAIGGMAADAPVLESVATEGAIFQLKGRLTWLRRLRQALEH
jgi:DNA-binding PadR family transcriptional regulator